jgi:trimeric autotransporter adhesin
MKKLILLGFMGLCTMPIIAQTITAPVGQSLTVTNPIDITVAGGTINVPADGAFKIGGIAILKTKLPNNLFLGENSGNATTTGNRNVFLGTNTGSSITSGTLNLFLGYNAGFANTTGDGNMFGGYNAGLSNTTGGRNVFFGTYSGTNNTIGEDNFFLGYNSGAGNISGSFNCYLGTQAGNTATGNYNTFIGYAAGAGVATGTQNTYVGYGANGSAGLVNAVAIGYGATATANSTVVLGEAATTITGKGLSAGNSGLRFANLNSTSAATAIGGSKVLTVDASGNVILATLNAGTLNSIGSNGPVAESTWKNQDGYLYNNSTNGVVINGSGLEGNALIVKGGVLSKEVNVKIDGSDSWPDYVFKPNYKRMTLEEVERFININGHLPNVPSATEMAQTGNNLGKTDIKLLEKVEELTLYLLEMKKANDAQSAEIQSLKNQMSKLKKSRK